MSIVMRGQREWPWFLAQLRPNGLALARRNLLRQGFEVFCPMQAVTRRTSAGFRLVERALFPGYLFVRFDLSSPGWRAINGTYGVARLVSSGSMPQPVPTAIVEGLRLRCGSDGRLLPPEDLRIGDSVRVTAGPFADFVCTVESITEDRRVWVLLDILGRETRVAVPADAMQKAGG